MTDEEAYDAADMILDQWYRRCRRRKIRRAARARKNRRGWR